MTDSKAKRREKAIARLEKINASPELKRRGWLAKEKNRETRRTPDNPSGLTPAQHAAKERARAAAARWREGTWSERRTLAPTASQAQTLTQAFAIAAEAYQFTLKVPTPNQFETQRVWREQHSEAWDSLEAGAAQTAIRDATREVYFAQQGKTPRPAFAHDGASIRLGKKWAFREPEGVRFGFMDPVALDRPLPEGDLVSVIVRWGFDYGWTGDFLMRPNNA